MTRATTGSGQDAMTGIGDVEVIRRLLAERSVWPVFQPIVDLVTGVIVGVEALARGPAGSSLVSPAELFATAARAGLLPEVDQLCAARGLELARDAAAGVHQRGTGSVGPAAES